MLTHNSTTVKDEPLWSTTDQSKLNRNAFADPGDPEDRGSWLYAHHHIEHGEIGPRGVYVRGNMYLNREGLRQALATTAGMHDDEPPRAHLLAHARAIGIDEKKASAKTVQSTTESHAEDKTNKVETTIYTTLTDFSRRGVVEATTTESIEALKAVEDDCLLHFTQAKQSAKTWVEKEEAESMIRQVQQFVAIQRRRLLSKPDIEKARERYNLGKQIGSAK